MKNKIVYKFIKSPRFATGFVPPRGGAAAPGRQIEGPYSLWKFLATATNG